MKKYLTKHFFYALLLVWGLLPTMAYAQPPGTQGLYFDGVDDYVSVPHIAATSFAGNANYTVEMWVKLPELNAFYNLAVKNAGGGALLTTVFTITNTGVVTFATDKAGTGWEYGNTSAGLIPINKWTHLAFVSNAGTKEIYVNGVSQSLSLSGSGMGAQLTAGASTQPWNFGISGGFGGGFFKGQLDEIRIFNSVRDATDIASDMASTTADGAVMFLRMNDGSGQSVADIGSGANAGTLGTDSGVATDDPVWALRVKNVNAIGTESLRQAINYANINSDTNYIDFSIQQDGTTSTIATHPDSLLIVTNPVIIDGYSAFGSSKNTNAFTAGINPTLKVEINGVGIGSAAFPGEDAIRINSVNNCIIKGLSIYGVPNNAGSQRAISILGTSANCSVEGCFIGLNASGASVPNMNGIIVGGSNNVIGWSGTIDVGKFNVVSANNYNGIILGGTNNIVQGNYIGTNPAGNLSFGNGFRGIAVSSSTSAQILNNLISGNGSEGGIRIQAGATGTAVKGNKIGTQRDGSTPLGNTNEAIVIIDAGTANSIIGGTGAGEANTIAHNGSYGVYIDGTGGGVIGHVISGNNIYSNIGGGISLVSGGNNTKSAPTILTASASTITGTCASGDVVEVFQHDANVSQGKTYKGQATVTGTTWTFTGTFTVGQWATATATTVTDGTSAFSAPLEVSGTYYSIASANWNVAGTWSNTSGGGSCGCTPNAGSDVIIEHNVNVPNTTDINNNNITVKAAGTLNLAVGNVNNINTLITEAGSTININANDFNLAYPATTTINGIINRNNTGTFPNGLTFANGSTYRHGIDGGVIPTATWGASSTMRVTGVLNNSPTGFSQTFGNFTWDCTGQTGVITISATMTIAGNLTLTSSGGQSLSFGSSTVNIQGNMVQNIGASFNASTSTFVFNSSTNAQTISGASGPTFHNLVIDNTAPTPTVSMTSAAPYTVNNALTLTNGRLLLAMSSGNLTYNGTSANLTRTNGWIQSTTSASFRRTSTASPFTFPVGSATAYQPITLTNVNNPCLVRFGASTLATPASIGSWYINNGATASDVTLVNPQGVVSGSVAHKYNTPTPSAWNALTTMPSGMDYVVTSALLGTAAEISIFAPAVTATAATNVTTTSFTANWTSVVGATSYDIEVSTTGSFTGTPTQAGLTSTSSVRSGLSFNTVYYYKVRQGAPSVGTWSNTKVVSTSLPAGSGRMLTFDGVDDKVQFSALPATNTTTIEFWYRPQNNAPSTIFHNTGSGAVAPSTGLWLERVPSLSRLVVSLGRDGDRSIQNFSYTMDINKWYHVAVAYNHPSVTLYINGVSIGTAAFSSPGFGNPTFNSAEPLIFGDFLSGYATNGQIDEIKIWNTTRTIDQIRASMCSKLVGNETGLVGYFRFDENTGTVVENKATSSTVDGTLINAPTWATSSAPIGDVSANTYGGTSVTLTNTDVMQASNITGSPTGVHLYKVNVTPNTVTPPSNYASLYTDRYWGMFFVDGTTPQATLTYNYSANSTVDVANALRFAQRDNNADNTWASMGGVQNRLSRRLTHTETNAGEYVLAERNAIISNYRDGGTILTYNGTSGYVDMPRYVENDFTIEFWLRTTQTGAGSIDWETGTGLVTANTTGITNDFGITLLGTKVAFGTGGASNTTIQSTTNVNDGKWVHVAVTRSGTTLRLFIDGKQEATATGNAGAMNSSTRLHVGKLQSGGNFFDGSIDELRIWNTALTEITLKDWVNLRANDGHPNFTSLEAYYRFDENIGTLTEDLVNGNDATLFGGVTWADANMPLGDGAVTRLIVPATSGSVSVFPQAGVTVNFGAATPNGEVVVTRIDGEPESYPGVAGMNFMNCYWVVRNYGTNTTFSGLPEIKFEIPAGNTISGTDLSNPNNIKLYKRPDDAIGSGTWVGVARATGFGSVRFAQGFAGGSPTGIEEFSQFVIGSPSSALPITLLGLKGRRVEGLRGEMTEEVSLEWSTASEINNKGFEVEMSQDGLAYQKIAFVEGKGNSQTVNSYQLAVNNASDAYYRLRQVDFGGTFSYSPVVFVAGMVGKDFVIVYPNPTETELKLKVSASILPTDILKVEVYDVAGKRVWRGAGKLSEIESSLQQTFRSWKAGIYLLQIQTNKKKLQTKIVKE